MFTRKSGILALALSALVLGACDDDETIAPPTQVVTVQVAPNPVPSVTVGQTTALLAIVGGTTNQAVTWQSLNTTVADVSAAGVVTCKTAGTATIVATSQADTNVRQAVAVQCVAGTGGPVEGTPTISIARITTPAGNDVNPGNVGGVINVVTNVDIPQGVEASAVRVTVNGTEVCRTSFAATGSADAAESVPVTVVCSFNTARLAANGAPLFPNGPYTIVAEVLGPTGTAIASSQRDVVFNNVNALQVTATASGATAQDNAGLTWATGDLTVTVRPAIFTGTNNNIARATISVYDDGDLIAQREVTTPAADGSFTTTFTKAPHATNGLNDVAEAEGVITVLVNTVTTGGNTGTSFGFTAPGAQAGNDPLRLDNDAPDDDDGDADMASFNNPGWFSTTTTLTGAARVTNLGELSDEGVNVNTVRFEYNTNGAATNASSGWTAFTDVSALPETTTNTELAFRAVVCDRLNNCTPVGPVQSGVDRSAPSVRVESGPGNNAVNPTTELQIVGTDAISGTETVQVRTSGRSVFEIDANADTDLRCYDASGALVSTNPTSGTCPTRTIATVAGPGATEDQATVVIPADENWYTIEITTIDVAGNASTTTVTRNYLVDAEIPTATISSTTITGTSSSISGTVQDNIQVRAYDSRFNFPGLSTPDQVPFSGMTEVDATLDNTLTGQASAAASSSLVVREIREGVAGAPIAPNQYGFGVLDMANLFGFNGAGIGFGAGDGVENTANVTLTPSPATVCRTVTASCPASTSLVVDVQTTVPPTAPDGTPQPFTNPVARVYYYYTHPGADGALGTGDDYLVLIGSTDASAATVETSAATGVRTFRFTQPLAASALPSNGGTPVTAIAVDAEGDAILVSNTVTRTN